MAKTTKLLMAALLSLVMVFAAAPPVLAGYGFAPKIYKSGYTFGNGIYYAPYEVKVHAEPSEESPLVEHLDWSGNDNQGYYTVLSRLKNRYVRANTAFICFYPDLAVAMMAVVGENGKNWLEVVYDQESGKTGWVKMQPVADEGRISHFGRYQTWFDFMKYNARSHGIYWLSGVSSYHRAVRYKDEDKSPLIPVTVIRDLKVRHIRGNWMLVEVLDFERNTPIGWVRWRDSDGNLLVFPNISSEHQPIMTTAL